LYYIGLRSISFAIHFGKNLATTIQGKALDDKSTALELGDGGYPGSFHSSRDLLQCSNACSNSRKLGKIARDVEEREARKEAQWEHRKPAKNKLNRIPYALPIKRQGNNHSLVSLLCTKYFAIVTVRNSPPTDVLCH